MKDNDQIKDLFSDKLGGFEAKVNPELWGKVASQIGAGSAAATTGMSLVTKFIIGLSAASVVTVGSIILLNNEEIPEKEAVQAEVKEEVKENNKPENTIIITPEEVEEEIEPTSNNIFVEPETEIYEPEVLINEPIVSPEERITREDDPLHNVFKPHDQLPAPEIVLPEPEEVDPVIISIPEESLITNESTEIKVVFPNVFTPNNDGINDLLFISRTENIDEGSFLISIVDENFREVYSSQDPNFEWNGYDKGGEPLKAGHYIALITCKDKDGKEAKPVMYQFEIRK